MAGCCGGGDGMQAVRSPAQCMDAPREKLMYVSCIQSPQGLIAGLVKDKKPDYLATVDIDPASATFCQVVHRLYMPDADDELHHFGWNACVSCPNTPRRYIVLPGFFSGNIHIVDATTDPCRPQLIKQIKGKDIAEKYNVSYPHTVHCIPSGDVMIHTLGNAQGDARGAFYLLAGNTFEPKGLWNSGTEAIKGHDFWYQPRHNIMISTEFGAPNKFTKGFDIKDVEAGYYGSKIHFWRWTERELFQTIDLGDDGRIPMEIRFVHNPQATDAYIVTALGASIFHVRLNEDKKWEAKAAVKIPHKTVSHWALPFVPALITDALISLDDKYLFVTCYLHGDVRQYDISQPDQPRLVSQIFVGGVIVDDTGVKVDRDEELSHQPSRTVIKNRKIHGGPHMIQLSRDGKRLYVTVSIITPWDAQFYPDLIKHGGVMLLLDVTDQGLTLNPDFLVDFGKEPDGAVRGHEMRYPGGDCTSDIWV
ncbi:methanethiol oxidase-like [Paramacrobiotus metropolitanus]|uniref:methanethiol oxidase-like n=1 Tax=Paramacrobiotus metropolitanus TaxID=2943436 RepID=UPI002445AF59|nr:methanethiol oxidase-like [Paramacrobiotus metropolitanus]